MTIKFSAMVSNLLPAFHPGIAVNWPVWRFFHQFDLTTGLSLMASNDRSVSEIESANRQKQVIV
jgi:hypothetical protein